MMMKHPVFTALEEECYLLKVKEGFPNLCCVPSLARQREGAETFRRRAVKHVWATTTLTVLLRGLQAAGAPAARHNNNNIRTYVDKMLDSSSVLDVLDCQLYRLLSFLCVFTLQLLPGKVYSASGM